MRIAYYAPLKSPTHGTPSGDRRVAALLIEALTRAGHDVRLVSTFSSYDRNGDAARQAALREQGIELAQRLVMQWCDGTDDPRPDLWVTYHLFYKAPDWLGPHVSTALGIPYVVAEPSYAAKRAGGAWAIGHDACAEAIRRAALLICPSRDDIAGVMALVGSPQRIVHLPPFLDLAPFGAASQMRDAYRGKLAADNDLDTRLPWILAVAMMRPGDKLASYRELASALRRVADLDWQIIVAGDGPARAEVDAAFEGSLRMRTRFVGEKSLADLVPLYAACDVFAWPAVNEAYGMAMLEAQAAGLAVVSSDLRGVPDVVVHGRTGLLAPPGDSVAFAARLRELLTDRERCSTMGTAAAHFVRTERGVDAAADRLADALAPLDAAPVALQ